MRRLCPQLVLLIVPLLVAFNVSTAAAQTVSTLVPSISGSGDIAVDTAGNIYVADFGDLIGTANGTTVSRITPEGVVSLFASGLSGAAGNEFDSEGNLYQSNISIGVISKIDPAGNVSTFSTGHAAPVGIAIDNVGNVYVANCGDNSIRRVTQAGVMTTIAQGGLLSCPNGLTFAEDGNLYTCNFNNGSVLRVSLGGVVTAFGTAPGNNNAHITYRHGALWLAARGGHRIYRFDLQGNRKKVAGFSFRGNSDGDKSVATFSLPVGIGMSPDGTKLYVNSTEALAGSALNPRLIRVIDISQVTATPEVAQVAVGPSVRAFPNPARPHTRIEYELPRTADVSLRIFDVRGREVRTLWDGSQVAGRRSVSWDGTDGAGRPLAAGVYLYTLRVGDQVTKDRVTLIR